MLLVESSLDLILSFFIYDTVLTPMKELSYLHVLQVCEVSQFVIVFVISFLRRINLTRGCRLLTIIVAHFY